MYSPAALQSPPHRSWQPFIDLLETFASDFLLVKVSFFAQKSHFFSKKGKNTCVFVCFVIQ